MVEGTVGIKKQFDAKDLTCFPSLVVHFDIPSRAWLLESWAWGSETERSERWDHPWTLLFTWPVVLASCVIFILSSNFIKIIVTNYHWTTRFGLILWFPQWSWELFHCHFFRKGCHSSFCAWFSAAVFNQRVVMLFGKRVPLAEDRDGPCSDVRTWFFRVPVTACMKIKDSRDRRVNDRWRDLPINLVSLQGIWKHMQFISGCTSWHGSVMRFILSSNFSNRAAISPYTIGNQNIANIQAVHPQAYRVRTQQSSTYISVPSNQTIMDLKITEVFSFGCPILDI